MKIKLSTRIGYTFFPEKYEAFKYEVELEAEKEYPDDVSTEVATKELSDEIKKNIAREVDVSSQEYLVMTEKKKMLYKKALSGNK